MTTVAASNESQLHEATAAEIEIRFRPDIVWESQSGGKAWIAQDPVRGVFFAFNELEYSAAMLIESSRSLNEVLGRLRMSFPSTKLSVTWLLTLLQRFQQFHLLQPVTDRQLRQLISAENRQPSKQILSQILSPLAIRIPLGDPSQWLNPFKPVANLLFHRWVVPIAMAFAALSLALVVRNLFVGNFSFTQELRHITGDRIAIGLVCYVVCKCLHELGHALACLKHGARCKEVGIMLLCFTPCLYCDTTDSWKLPSRWQRAGIAAAGMYVELIIASLAAVVWLCTVEGTLHYLAASTMVVCSISTLLINANPLLKYDGYYILADTWNIPNLQEQSRTAANTIIQRIFTKAGLNEQPIASQLDSSPSLLAAYWLAAICYRTCILFVILALLWYTLVPLGFGMVAIALSAILGIGLGFAFLGWLKTLTSQLKGRSWRLLRVFVAIASITGLSWFSITFPIPVRTTSVGIADASDKSPVFAPTHATLKQCATPGATVDSGDLIAELESLELDSELAELKGDADLIRIQIEALEEQQTDNETVAYRLPVLKEQLRDRQERLKLLEEQKRALNIFAAANGRWLPSDSKSAPSLTEFHDERNANLKVSPNRLGCQVKEGELLGWVVVSDKVFVNALVHEDTVRRLDHDVPVTLRWDSQPHIDYRAQIVSIAREAMRQTPPTVVGDPRFLSVRDSQGNLVPDSPHYEVKLQIDSSILESNPERTRRLLGSLASVRFETHRSTILEIVREYIEQNLRPIY